MNPVVGLDISKGESQVQAFFDKGKPYQKSFKITHTVEGLNLLVAFLEDVKKESGQKPSVVFEATGHYQTPVVHYLEERGYLLIIVNPLISYKGFRQVVPHVQKIPQYQGLWRDSIFFLTFLKMAHFLITGTSGKMGPLVLQNSTIPFG
ncbi:hypothetical protein ASG99_27545 [Bacillus sp. Soil768D1]|nr:hypothetical protein ASG99_27545 [Bacillus sp. Soil768D1]